MADTGQPQADRRAGALRRPGRGQVLPLRQLHRGLPVLRGAVHLPAKLDALPPDGAGGQAAGQPRAVALLLLRRVLRAVPARGRARRDHDEPAPLADRAVRLHRHLARSSTAPGSSSSAPSSWWRCSPGSGSSLYGFSPRQHRAVYDGPGAFLPSSCVHWFDWGMAGVLLALAPDQLRPHVVVHMGRDTDAARVRSAPTCARPGCSRSTSSPRSATAKCERKRPWLIHLVLMLSYVTMLVLIMFFLHAMQSGPAIDWQVHVFGYAATIGLLVTTVVFLRSRLQKDRDPVPALARDRLDLPRHAVRRGRDRDPAARPAPLGPRRRRPTSSTSST